MNYYFWAVLTLISYFHSSESGVNHSIETINEKRIFTTRYCYDYDSHDAIDAPQMALNAIQREAFWLCKNVSLIDLRGNRIKELHSDTFKFNTNLTTLNLQCNSISFLSKELLKPLVNLEKLSLSGNPLRTLEPIIYNDLRKLKTLHVASIELQELDLGVFVEKLPALTELNFAGNLIECSVYNAIESNLTELQIQTIEDRWECETYPKLCLSPQQSEIIVQYREVTNIENTFNEKVKNLWITIILMTVAFFLIIGLLFIKTFIKASITGTDPVKNIVGINGSNIK